MYAIIRDRGKQYTVREGDTLEIDLLSSPGDTHEFNEVLLLSGEGDVKVGVPTVAGAKVTATVVGEQRGPKLYVMKFRRRKDSKTKRGHRQRYTQVKIETITAG